MEALKKSLAEKRKPPGGHRAGRRNRVVEVGSQKARAQEQGGLVPQSFVPRDILNPDVQPQHRKARVLFGLSDIILTALAFEAAYQTRVAAAPGPRRSILTVERKALVLGFSLLAWVTIGLWLEVYDKLDSGHPRVILRDSARQCAYGALCLVVFEYVFRLDLSRFFLVLFSAYAWVLLLLFRLTAGRMVGVIRREFARAPLRDGGGHRASARIRMARGAGAVRRIRHPAARLSRRRRPARPREIHSARRLPGAARSANLPAMLRQHVIDEIIFAVDSDSLAELEEVFLLCDEEGVRTRVAVDFFPHVNSTVSLDRFGATPLLTFSAAPHDEIRLLVKRVIDIADRRRRPDGAVALHAADRAADPPDLARPRHLPPGALRFEWPPLPVLQVPLHVRERRRAEGRPGTPEHARRPPSRSPTIRA